jgi:hypothetical protein
MRLLRALLVIFCVARAGAQCGEAYYNVLVPTEQTERKCGVNANSVCSTSADGAILYDHCSHNGLPKSACAILGRLEIKGYPQVVWWAVDFGVEISITRVQMDLTARAGNIGRVTIGNSNAIGVNAICGDVYYANTEGQYVNMNCALKGQFMHVFMVGPEPWHPKSDITVGWVEVSSLLSSCIACPTGSTNSSLSATTISDCKCKVGYTGTDGSPCTVCVIGKYKNSIGSASCTNCPAGSYSSTAGASACVTCGAGNFSTTVGASSASACVPCPAGTYSNLTHGPGGRCTACPPILIFARKCQRVGMRMFCGHICCRMVQHGRLG